MAVKGPKSFNGTRGWYVAKELEKQENMKEIIDALSDAILATGRPFKDIPKSSITDYLTKVGVNKSKHEEIYQKLTEIYKVKTKVNSTDDFYTGATSSTPSKSLATKPTTAVTAKTKERQPRKNVFSEITKIQ